jgi:selenocysteine-specific elongation factor
LTEALPVVKGDFFIIRSAEDTLGGGQVVDPNPRRRHRRFVPEVVERLMMLSQGSGEDMLLSVADQWGPCDLRTLSQRSNLSTEEALERAVALAEAGDLVILGNLGAENDAVVYSAQGWDILKGKVRIALQTYHNRHPLRRGAPTQEIRSRTGLSQGVYLKALARLVEESCMVEEGQQVRLPDHQVTLTPELERQATAYLQSLEHDPYSPPTERHPDPELLGVLIDEGKVVKVNESVIFAASAYRELTEKIVTHLEAKGSITVADARTMFDTSRKYILPLLEHLDQQRVTRRVGDERVLR